DDVLNAPHEGLSLDIFHHPLRMELTHDCEIAFGDHCLLGDGVTLLSSIEQFNFDQVPAGTELGFVPLPLDQCLTLKDANGSNRIHDFFCLAGTTLKATQDLKLFMVTTNPEIARKDCLFYLVEAKTAVHIDPM
ncbi:MAG: hypothetical protein RLN96_09395, partial [Pseudomonadales bacterium]